MSSRALVSARNLRRIYGDIHVVTDVSFEVQRGEVLGFLGPNGAGKSTTMQMVSGTLAPSAGQVLIDGVDIFDEPKAAKARLGYLPEQPPLYRDLTVDEYLTYCARLRGIARANLTAAVGNAKERCGLANCGRRLIGNLSKGYQQRVGIAQAIVHSPAVVILDEPTVGLDPIQIREIRKLIRELGGDHSVILSTHILPEVQAVCDRLQIIHQGRLVLSQDLGELAHSSAEPCVRVALHRPPSMTELEALPGVRRVEPLGDSRLRVHHCADSDIPEVLVSESAKRDWGLFELVAERRSLEEIFVELTCREPSSGDDPNGPVIAEAA